MSRTTARLRTTASVGGVLVATAVLAGCSGGGATGAGASPVPVVASDSQSPPAQPSPAPTAPSSPTTENPSSPVLPVSGPSSPPTSPPTSSPTVAAPRATTRTEHVIILNARSRADGGVDVTYDPVLMLTGAAAQAYWAEHPELEPAEWAVANDEKSFLTLTLPADAVVVGSQRLGPGNGTQTARISGQQLVQRMRTTSQVVASLRTSTLAGRTTIERLEEVYLP